MQTNAQLLRELMDRYHEYRDKWVAMFGNDDGFNQWFSEQLGF